MTELSAIKTYLKIGDTEIKTIGDLLSKRGKEVEEIEILQPVLGKFRRQTLRGKIILIGCRDGYYYDLKIDVEKYLGDEDAFIQNIKRDSSICVGINNYSFDLRCGCASIYISAGDEL